MLLQFNDDSYMSFQQSIGEEGQVLSVFWIRDLGRWKLASIKTWAQLETNAAVLKSGYKSSLEQDV